MYILFHFQSFSELISAECKEIYQIKFLKLLSITVSNLCTYILLHTHYIYMSVEINKTEGYSIREMVQSFGTY